MKNKDKIILDLCGGTGSWSKPYKDAGYTVFVLTLPEYDVERVKDTFPFFVQKMMSQGKIYGILAAPPCTMFSIARNDKTAKEKRDLKKGLGTVNACLEVIAECLYNPYQVEKNSLKFWALENPYTGYLKRFLGNPPYVFDPSDFGENHSKKTALWGMFNEPKKTTKGKVVKGDANNYVKSVEKFFDEKKHLIPEGYKQKTGLSMRTIVRSITPQGFAEASFKANQ